MRTVAAAARDGSRPRLPACTGTSTALQAGGRPGVGAPLNARFFHGSASAITAHATGPSIRRRLRAAAVGRFLWWLSTTLARSATRKWQLRQCPGAAGRGAHHPIPVVLARQLAARGAAFSSPGSATSPTTRLSTCSAWVLWQQPHPAAGRGSVTRDGIPALKLAKALTQSGMTGFEACGPLPSPNGSCAQAAPPSRWEELRRSNQRSPYILNPRFGRALDLLA